MGPTNVVTAREASCRCHRKCAAQHMAVQVWGNPTREYWWMLSMCLWHAAASKVSVFSLWAQETSVQCAKTGLMSQGGKENEM